MYFFLTCSEINENVKENNVYQINKRHHLDKHIVPRPLIIKCQRKIRIQCLIIEVLNMLKEFDAALGAALKIQSILRNLDNNLPLVLGLKVNVIFEHFVVEVLVGVEEDASFFAVF